LVRCGRTEFATEAQRHRDGQKLNLNTPVHILATVRKPELLKAALLVFRTLRTGFPQNPVYMWGNGLEEGYASAVGTVARSVGAEFKNVPATSHDAWIETMIQRFNEPFWILDTDVVFFGEMKPAGVQTEFAGRFEPEFDEEFTDSIHVERLHTCVMWIDPAAVRGFIRRYMARVPEPWRNSAQFPLIRQNFVPVLDGRTKFYDTMAGLYQAGAGMPFKEDRNAAFVHLHCATYADEVAKQAPSLRGIAAAHDFVYSHPECARDLSKVQQDYYLKRATNSEAKGKL
jgi:hypothetical protein